MRLRNNRNRNKKEDGDLVHYVLDQNNPFNDRKTENINKEDDWFDDNDSKDIKKVSDDTVETINLIDGVPFVDLKRKQNSRSKKTYQKI